MFPLPQHRQKCPGTCGVGVRLCLIYLVSLMGKIPPRIPAYLVPALTQWGEEAVSIDHVISFTRELRKTEKKCIGQEILDNYQQLTTLWEEPGALFRWTAMSPNRNHGSVRSIILFPYGLGKDDSRARERKLHKRIPSMLRLESGRQHLTESAVFTRGFILNLEHIYVISSPGYSNCEVNGKIMKSTFLFFFLVTVWNLISNSHWNVINFTSVWNTLCDLVSKV